MKLLRSNLHNCQETQAQGNIWAVAAAERLRGVGRAEASLP